MRIDVLTLFPEMFKGPFEVSMLARAQALGLLELNVIGLRPFGVGPHLVTDDYPYGGGPGMLMRPEPIVRAAEWAGAHVTAVPQVVVMSAQGVLMTQGMLEAWARTPYLQVIAGHYEGIDQRVIDILGAKEVSVGSFVLTGGELPAMLLVDGVARLLPGVLGDPEGARADSFSDSGDGRRWLEGPQYTRPWEFRGHVVPEILRSGHHQLIRDWRYQQALAKTRQMRPDLLEHAQSP